MINIREEKGMAFLLVLLSLIILSCTALAIYSGIKSQGNTTSMVVNSKIALKKAENALTLYMQAIRDGNASDIQDKSPITYPDDGWNIRVTFDGVTLTATASRDRYSRTVAVNCAFTEDTDFEPNYALFTEGNLTIDRSTLNSKNMDFYAKGDVKIGSGNNLDQVKVIAEGNITSPSYPENQLKTTPNHDSDVELPEYDFDSVTPTKIVTTSDENFSLENELKALKDTGGTLLVKVDKGEVIYKNADINFTNKVDVVFVRAEGYTGDYFVHFQNVSNFNAYPERGGELNLYADGGGFYINNVNMNNPNGILYTNAETKTYYVDGRGAGGGNTFTGAIKADTRNQSLKLRSIMAKGDIVFDKVDYNYSATVGLESGEDEVPTEGPVQFSGWREISEDH